MTNTEHTEPQSFEEEQPYRMLSLGGDHVTVSGMTKHYVQLINEAIMANPHHPMVEGMELSRYLNVIVASDGGVPFEDFQYMMNTLPLDEVDNPDQPEEDISPEDQASIDRLMDGAGWTSERARRKILGTSAGQTAVKASNPPRIRKPRAKSHYHPSKVPDNDNVNDPYWKAGDGPVVRTAEDEMHLAALRAAAIADIKRLRAAQDELLRPAEEKDKAPSVTQWESTDQAMLKQSFGMYGFYPERPVEAKALKRMNGQVNNMMTGLSYFDDLAYREGIATNVEKKERLEEEAGGLLEALDSSLDGITYGRAIIHRIDESGIGDGTSFANVFPYDEIVVDPNLRAQLMVLAGFRENQRITEGEAVEKTDEDSPESRIEIIASLIHQSLGELSAGAVRSLAANLVKDEDRRFDHWYKVLKEASGHDYVRDVITSGLERIDKQLEESS
ncbi:MAG: hypothetical protein WAO28_02235 [Candidatus Microsaccharimonas sp.]